MGTPFDLSEDKDIPTSDSPLYVHAHFAAVLNMTGIDIPGAPHAADLPDTSAPVILLHGLGRTSLSMLPVKIFLRTKGFRCYNFGYRSRKESVREHAARLDSFIKAKALTSSPISFVTHSLGGIIVRELARQKPEVQFRRVLMLAPPTQGSQLGARVAKVPLLRRTLGASLDDIVNLNFPRSGTFRELGIIAGEAFSGSSSAFVSGPNDGIVAVAETKDEAAADFLVVNAVHTFIMLHPEVLRQTAHFLTYGTFRRQ